MQIYSFLPYKNTKEFDVRFSADLQSTRIGEIFGFGNFAM